MREGARLQAAIEILDEVIAATRDGGPAADTILERQFRARRYAGSHDRRAISDLVWRAIRRAGDRPPSGRAAIVGLVEAESPELLIHFDGAPRAPSPVTAEEPRAEAGLAPLWLMPRLRESLGQGTEAELLASLERAPLDLRVNRLKVADPERVRAALPFPAAPVEGLPIPLPFALRAEPGARIEGLPQFRDGLLEVQDAGSQLVTALAAARSGETVIDLCAGAGGKTLALAADMGGLGRLVACDTDRARLARLTPRAARAGAPVETRLLDAGREAEQLADLASSADLVLVDAPCSGSGTWRRNPELRWRLSPSRLSRLTALQARLLQLGAAVVRPGGRLVYAVCSLLDEEGRAQTRRFDSIARDFRPGAQLKLTPGTHGCDGFFVASWFRGC